MPSSARGTKPCPARRLPPARELTGRELAVMHGGRAFTEAGERGARFVIELDRVPDESVAVKIPEDDPAHRNGAVPSDEASRLNVQV